MRLILSKPIQSPAARVQQHARAQNRPALPRRLNSVVAAAGSEGREGGAPKPDDESSIDPGKPLQSLKNIVSSAWENITGSHPEPTTTPESDVDVGTRGEQNISTSDVSSTSTATAQQPEVEKQQPAYHEEDLDTEISDKYIASAQGPSQAEPSSPSVGAIEDFSRGAQTESTPDLQPWPSSTPSGTQAEFKSEEVATSPSFSTTSEPSTVTEQRGEQQAPAVSEAQASDSILADKERMRELLNEPEKKLPAYPESAGHGEEASDISSRGPQAAENTEEKVWSAATAEEAPSSSAAGDTSSSGSTLIRNMPHSPGYSEVSSDFSASAPSTMEPETQRTSTESESEAFRGPMEAPRSESSSESQVQATSDLPSSVPSLSLGDVDKIEPIPEMSESRKEMEELAESESRGPQAGQEETPTEYYSANTETETSPTSGEPPVSISSEPESESRGGPLTADELNEIGAFSGQPSFNRPPSDQDVAQGETYEPSPQLDEPKRGEQSASNSQDWMDSASGATTSTSPPNSASSPSMLTDVTPGLDEKTEREKPGDATMDSGSGSTI